MNSCVRRILAIADLHVLSYYGLSPDSWHDECGNVVLANDGQRRLLKYWRHLMSVLHEPEWKVDEVWVVGDVFSGLNPAEKGRKVLGSLDVQLDVATELLSMLPMYEEGLSVKIWSGSPYHETVDFKMHRQLAENLRGNGFRAVFKGSWSFERIGKSKLAFVTHESSSTVTYPHTAMVRDSRWFKIQGYDGKLPKVHLIVRAHKHFRGFIDDGRIKIVQLPCWCLYTPYTQALRNFPMWQPDIGGIFIFLDAEDRIRVQEWLYPPLLLTEAGDVIEPEYEVSSFVRGWE